MRQHGIPLRPGAVGISGLVLAFLLTGCGSGGAGSADRLGTPSANLPTAAATGSAAPAPSGTPVPSEGLEGAAGQAALTTYQSWWDAQADTFGRSDSDGTVLRLYATGTALGDTLATLDQLHRAKLVLIGKPRTSPVLKGLDLQANPATATITDCLDVTEWHQADAATKQIKDPQQRLSRYAATAVLRKSGNRWLIVDFTREVAKAC
ncbi:hypothetical protein AB0K51_00180 [Kitasatospora sp. NPDC049285]|uniref:hypothetical protein n=1 Tax=Kitasatospora sp. NPDC049285 TaxID=3157096 RepID=UPI00342FE28A